MRSKSHFAPLAARLFLNLFAAPFNVLPEAMHGVAARDRAQPAQQYQSRQDSLKHGASPVLLRE
jgi:hypothetical protein